MKPSLWILVYFYYHFHLVLSTAVPLPGYLPDTSGSCRCFVGEPCWPTEQQWAAFNDTIDGNLIKTVPLAGSCHDESFGPFNAAQCTAIQNSWFRAETHLESSSSPMAPYFTNNSCNPFSSRNTPCTLGGHVVYSVKATSVQHYLKTIEFIKTHNIRLVIRNTGHDYLGKSTGPGAVALWTHFMKDRSLTQFTSYSYSGPAIKFGAGVIVSEAYEFANSNGLVVVGGNVPSVGIAGGYSQGGGHGPLASTFGLAADQVLEWEAVTSDGKIATASASQNQDLYWALSGGGGGSYAAVTSMTVKAHPQLSMAASTLTFANNGKDAYWDAISSFHQIVPSLGEAGASAAWFISAASFTAGPIYAPNLSEDALNATLNPILDKLSELGLEFAYQSSEFPTFLEGFTAMSAPIDVANLQIGGRLIPRDLVETNNAGLTKVVQKITSDGAVFAGTSFNVSRHGGTENAVNPYFRRSIFGATIGTLYDYANPEVNLFWQRKITEEFLPSLAQITPEGAAYLNEADFRQPDFKTLFYGDKYDELDAVKAKYDPADIFYAITAVGSHRWAEALDGRLCKIENS